MKEKRVIFMGTPKFAVPILQILIDNTNVVGVVSQPNKEVGRKKILELTPIAKLAIDNSLNLLQPNKVKDAVNEIKELNPDIIVTCAYGQIIPEDILNIPKYGCINVHASLLPKLRGGAPIHYAIINGEEKTGITIMYMDKGMDTGDIISTREVKIEESDNQESLSEKLSICGKELLLDTLPSIFDKTNSRIKQDETQATYAPIIKKEDELIDFNNPKKTVFNKIRGLSKIPGGYFILDNKRIKVYESYMTNKICDTPSIISNIYKDGIAISTTDGEVVITKLKVEGKKEMLAKDYLNGIDHSTLINKKVN